MSKGTTIVAAPGAGRTGGDGPPGTVPSMATGPLAMRFLLSAADVGQLPPATREVALVGRSNVGKSTLINALAGRTKLAKTSKTPGATRLLNVYELTDGPPGRWLVDLPGYGYAKAAKGERDTWARMIAGYFDDRPTLTTLLWLIDSEVGPTRTDLEAWEHLVEVGRPIRVVGTKIDKVRSSKRPRRKADLTAALGLERGDVRWVSADKQIGIDELRTDVVDLLTL